MVHLALVEIKGLTTFC